MRTIEIDDDVFFYLNGASRSLNTSIGQVVRDLINPAETTFPRGPKPVAKPQGTAGDQRSPRDVALSDYVRSPGFLANRSVVDQFLSVLSFLHKQNPDKFELLTSLEGRTRKYIAKSEQELEASGTSVNPKQIPHSNFWVVTNNDTNNKRMLLKQALTLLGYSTETIRLVAESLR